MSGEFQSVWSTHTDVCLVIFQFIVFLKSITGLKLRMDSVILWFPWQRVDIKQLSVVRHQGEKIFPSTTTVFFCTICYGFASQDVASLWALLTWKPCLLIRDVNLWQSHSLSCFVTFCLRFNILSPTGESSQSAALLALNLVFTKEHDFFSAAVCVGQLVYFLLLIAAPLC